MPSLFEVVVLSEDGYDHLAKPDVPYYLIAHEGTFLHKDTQIGDVLVKETAPPKTLPKLGAPGVFRWHGDRIPSHIISQAHDFFLRIYTEHHTEAEVLITKHNETSEFRLFVPYQRVSHAGVKSIYEPTHVSSEYTVVGTLHSHCDFSAFHSGTDSGDASDMDGVHFTIGQVTKEQPEIVAMVAMNGKEFHYKNPSDIADIEWRTQTAPPWWDTYVFANNDAPATKPASLISLTQDHWNEFLGRALFKPKKHHVVSSPKYPNWSPNTWPGTNKWSSDAMFETSDWRREVYGAGRPTASNVRPDKADPTLLDIALDEAERYNLLTEDDWDDTKDADRDQIGYWQGFFVNKLEATLDVLSTLGLEYTVGRQSKKGKK